MNEIVLSTQIMGKKLNESDFAQNRLLFFSFPSRCLVFELTERMDLVICVFFSSKRSFVLPDDHAAKKLLLGINFPKKCQLSLLITI